MLKQNILRILMENARTPVEEIAVRLGSEPAAVAAAIAELEEAKIIRGYTAIVNREALSDSKVRAQIEVRVQPRREGGFVFMHHVTEDDIVAGKLVTPTSWLHRLVGKSKPV